MAAPVLERRAGKLVWRVRHDEPEHCLVGPTLATVYERDRKTAFIRVVGAGGYVDAATGRVIRFRRHYRVYGVAGN